jgi:predicted nucleotidyltransferase
MTLSDLKNKFRDKILRIASECGIDEVKVFGSTVRGDATEESDVDLLVSAKETTSLLDIGRFKWKTEELLQKKVVLLKAAYIIALPIALRRRLNYYDERRRAIL